MKKGKWVPRVFCVSMSLVLALLFCEVGLRLSGFAKEGRRALFFSSATFETDRRGAVRYRSSELIRSVAVYGGRIEYDVTFQTNGMGLIDDREYVDESSSTDRRFAFVGDSFTAGVHGGVPWVPALARDVETDRSRVYNLGVTGTGLEHFSRLLESVDEDLRFTDIVILAISNDFERRYWHPVANEEGIWFCVGDLSAEVCLERAPVAGLIPFEASEVRILEAAERMNRDWEAPLEGLSLWLWRHSSLGRFVYDRLSQVARGRVREGVPVFAVKALGRIRERFPEARIHLVHLPQKDEVMEKRYRMSDLEVVLDPFDIVYRPLLERREWSLDMYHSHDPHPNDKGYDAIRAAVARELFAVEL